MDYCRKAPQDDAYCYDQPRARMDSMCGHFPLDPRSLTDPRVKAIAAVGPTFGMLFSHQAGCPVSRTCCWWALSMTT